MRLVLFKGNTLEESKEGGIRYVTGNGGAKREIDIHLEDVEPGSYNLYVELTWNGDDHQRDFVISSYGSSEVTFGEESGDKYHS